jgi:hypothetical protein
MPITTTDIQEFQFFLISLKNHVPHAVVNRFHHAHSPFLSLHSRSLKPMQFQVVKKLFASQFLS